MIPSITVYREGRRGYTVDASFHRHYTWCVHWHKVSDWHIPRFHWYTTQGVYSLDIGKILIDIESLAPYGDEMRDEG